MEKIKAVFNWSGGKDSAHALYKILKENRYDIVALLTTINKATRQSTMHHIPYPILELQADSIGIPLYTVDLTPKGNMEDYSQAMNNAVTHFKQTGVTHFIFGDIFLHDIRKYREEHLNPLGITVIEPLWNKSTYQIMDEFLATGLRSVIVTTMEELGERYIGKLIDRDFVNSLPYGSDPNGENGEYHSLCFDGPIFKYAIPFELGEPQQKNFDLKSDNGKTKTYFYWSTDIKVPNSQCPTI